MPPPPVMPEPEPEADAASVRRLVELCLERGETEGVAALEAICADHPRLAARIRRRVTVLRILGLYRFARR